MNFKNTLLLFFILCLFSSCQLTTYGGYIGQSVVTQVELSAANFKVLGSFTGTATAKKVVLGIKDKTGVISAAKKDLIENAKKAGVELTGARTLINLTTDVIQNSNRITCTISAEVIEFQ
ncbi:MAG: DUF6567 family protein [Aureispira sp.]